jgi:hypothetical protein
MNAPFKSSLLTTKLWPFKSVWFQSAVCFAVWAVVSCAHPQTLLGLNAQMYAGLTITGAVSYLVTKALWDEVKSY